MDEKYIIKTLGIRRKDSFFFYNEFKTILLLIITLKYQMEYLIDLIDFILILFLNC